MIRFQFRLRSAIIYSVFKRYTGIFTTVVIKHLLCREPTTAIFEHPIATKLDNCTFLNRISKHRIPIISHSQRLLNTSSFVINKSNYELQINKHP